MWQEQAYYIATHSYDVEPMAVNRKRLTQCHHPKFSRLKPFDIKKTNKQTNKLTPELHAQVSFATQDTNDQVLGEYV